jgi:type II secretory pathway pseudopilin PulG
MRAQGGFSYVVVMFLVAVSSVAAVRALENTLLAERRAKETELLWRGMAYYRAIQQYYHNAPGSALSHPDELAILLLDTRLARPTRPLRKLYRDPMTESDWAVMRDASGAVIGVYSTSQVKPIKQAAFPEELKHFKNAQHYSDWKFFYKPNN